MTATASGAGTIGRSLQGGVDGSGNDSGGGGGEADSDAFSGGGGSGFTSGMATMLIAATATGPGNAASPDRGTAGDPNAAGRVIVTMLGM